jgi:hypothetical protein
MKRYLAPVIVLLIASMLVSCGGGGDSTSGGSSSTTSNGADPGAHGNDSGGTPPGNDSGGTPPGNDSGGTPPGNDSGGTPPGNDSGGSSPLPSAGARVEEADVAVTLSAGWTKSDSRWGWSGGAAMQSTVAGATASFSFTGSSVTWIGRRNRDSGIALVRIDGGPPIEVDLFARPNEIRTNILTLYDLSEGDHTLTIEVTGRQNPFADSNIVVVDAFDVEPQIVSHLQETDPDVTLTAGWMHDPSSSWSGGGVHTSDDPVWGGMRYTETAGEKATVEFRGTSIRWSGYRGPDAGIARVQLGGVATEIDLYAPRQKYQEVVFTATGLADAMHTLTIEATGRKNDASTGTRVVVDAFDVTTPGRRYQEGDPAITYTGAWNERNVNRSWSEGAAAATSTLGARATFSFTGTSVSWVACEKRNMGRARIYIDGAVVEEEVNMKQFEPVEGFQSTVYRVDGLTNGPHTLTVEAVGGGSIVVDAFDVHP